MLKFRHTLSPHARHEALLHVKDFLFKICHQVAFGIVVHICLIKGAAGMCILVYFRLQSIKIFVPSFVCVCVCAELEFYFTYFFFQRIIKLTNHIQIY